MAKHEIPEDLELGRAVDAVLRTEAGRVLWAWLNRRLGFYQTTLVRFRGGDVAPLSTEALAALREAYLDLRELPSFELLIAAEALADPQNKALQKSKEEERKKK